MPTQHAQLTVGAAVCANMCSQMASRMQVLGLLTGKAYGHDSRPVQLTVTLYEQTAATTCPDQPNCVSAKLEAHQVDIIHIAQDLEVLVQGLPQLVDCRKKGVDSAESWAGLHGWRRIITVQALAHGLGPCRQIQQPTQHAPAAPPSPPAQQACAQHAASNCLIQLV